MVKKINYKKRKRKLLNLRSEARYGIKADRKGTKQKYVYVTYRKHGQRTVSKQYKYRGGDLGLYIREARIPKGTKYLVDYTKQTITISPNRVEAMLKSVKSNRKRKILEKSTLNKTIKRPIKKIPPVPLVVKKVRQAPIPIESRKPIDMMPNKVFYEREHSIKEFLTQTQESKFLLKILGNATKNPKHANLLLNNFHQIRNKFSFVVTLKGIDENKKESEIGYFNAIGFRPKQIADILTDLGLKFNDVIDIDSQKAEQIQYALKQKGFTLPKINKGTYRISDINLVVKFYNNPQTSLSKFYKTTSSRRSSIK